MPVPMQTDTTPATHEDDTHGTTQPALQSLEGRTETSADARLSPSLGREEVESISGPTISLLGGYEAQIKTCHHTILLIDIVMGALAGLLALKVMSRV